MSTARAAGSEGPRVHVLKPGELLKQQAKLAQDRLKEQKTQKPSLADGMVNLFSPRNTKAKSMSMEELKKVEKCYTVVTQYNPLYINAIMVALTNQWLGFLIFNFYLEMRSER